MRSVGKTDRACADDCSLQHRERRHCSMPRRQSAEQHAMLNDLEGLGCRPCVEYHRQCDAMRLRDERYPGWNGTVLAGAGGVMPARYQCGGFKSVLSRACIPAQRQHRLEHLEASRHPEGKRQISAKRRTPWPWVWVASGRHRGSVWHLNILLLRNVLQTKKKRGLSISSDRTMP